MSEQGVRDGLVADLDALSAGPELAAVLDDLSPDTLTGEELAAYVRACARLTNHGTARLLDAMHHLGRAQHGRTDRRQVLDEYSGDEVAVALGWSRSMACRKLDLADDLAARLPAVGEALWDGWLDEPKATRLCEWTRDLCDDHARHVTQELLPEAPSLPVGELIRRIEQVAAAIDPDWAARREARAAKNLRVTLTANPSGTATFAVCDTTAPRGLAMRDRCDAIAAAVRALGVRLPIGDLRGEVAARLLDGSSAGLTDHQIICILAAEYHAAGQPAEPDDQPDDDGDCDDPDDEGPGDEGPDGPRDDGPDNRGPDNGPAGGAPTDDRRETPDDAGQPGDGDPHDEGPAAGDDADAGDDAEAGEHAEGESAGQGVLDLPGLPEPGLPDPELSAEPPVPEFPPEIDGPDPGPGRVRTGTSELRLRLTTALGLDQYPATVPGYGTVLAHHARTLLTAAHHGEWRIVLTTPDGHLQHVLLARRRPARPRSDHQPRGPEQHRAIVELQVPTTQLAALDPHAHPTWTALLRELHTRLSELTELGVLGAPGPPRASLAEQLRRRPSAETERWTRVRDRCCIIPCCHRPAHRAELDHTHDWAHHGPSAHWNLGVLDTHHHRAKHHAHWQIHQPAPGHFAIRTRAGQRLHTTPKKILDKLPEPRPAHRPRPLPDDGWRTHPHDGDDAADAAADAQWRHQFLRRTTGATATGNARMTTTSSKAATVPAVHDPNDPPPF
ncbi:uncharacterized protein DUF222 [Actinomycetospora succinea]|uniref:Uncharacterized protein DUF222 n=1 Tax=Actinomycetospora succinea TaxID=663603 RepID=A0A4R6V3R9_9PSEU|nr:DUF222 domain-containing protein [Actinomycetospora succinea]TDQ50814.1 uncharacterized protein DUF222 [Actinomycetospora succinea]